MKINRGKYVLPLVGIMLFLALINGCSWFKKKEKKGAKTGEVTTQKQEIPSQPPISEGERQQAIKEGTIAENPETLKNSYSEPTGVLASKIYFDYDRSDIKNQYRPVLEKIAEWLKENGDVYVMIEGNCDERGTNEYNQALGERRALSVRRYLISLGVMSSRLHTISYGEEKPADPGHNEAAWAKNRRVEFKIAR